MNIKALVMIAVFMLTVLTCLRGKLFLNTAFILFFPFFWNLKMFIISSKTMEKSFKVSLCYRFPSENKKSVFLFSRYTQETGHGLLHGVTSVCNYGDLVWREKPGQNWRTQNSKNNGRTLCLIIILEITMGLWIMTGLCTIYTFQEEAANDQSAFFISSCFSGLKSFSCKLDLSC